MLMVSASYFLHKHMLYIWMLNYVSLFSPTSYFFGLMSQAVSPISLLCSVNSIPAFQVGYYAVDSSHVLQNHFFLFLDSFLPPSLLHLATSVLLAGLHTLSPMALPSRMCTHLVLFNFRVWKIVSLACLRFIILQFDISGAFSSLLVAKFYFTLVCSLSKLL